jgi:uncharacterized protein (TIGR02001 family)
MTMHPFYAAFIRLVCLGLLCYQPGSASAEIHGTITATTNYVFRMYSKSNNKPAIQANLDYQHDWGFYTGVTASSFDIGPSELDESFPFPTDFPDQANVEIIPYVGWSFKLADDWRTDFQYSRYFFKGKVYALNADYDEYYLFLHFRDLITAQASYAPDFYGVKGDSYFYEITGRYPLTDFLKISGSFGYAQTKKIFLDDYKYWNVGLSASYKFISIDLRYHDAVEAHLGDIIEIPVDHPNTLKGTIVFSLSLGF